ncbi:MAG: phage FluMu protein Com [Mariniblastus sp.]
MTIEFTCQHCNTLLRVPKEHAGKQARCPQCQELNVVQPDSQPDSQPVVFTSGPTSSPTAGQAPYAPNPYAGGQGGVLPPGRMQGYATPHRGGLVLALGIASICCNVMGVPGVMAWIFGRNDLKAMDAGLMDPEGRGLTQTGMIIGMVMSILALIGIAITICYILFFIILVAGVAANGM